MQASTVARLKLANLKQTGSVSAYATLFQKELTPIKDMSPADQVFFFRQGLKPHIAQRVLEKNPATLHAAMDIAVMADVQGRSASSYQSSGHRSHGGHSSHRVPQSGPVEMDISVAR
jgi:hypothetical protein